MKRLWEKMNIIWTRLLSHWYYLIAVTYRYMGNAYGLEEHYENAIDYFGLALSWNPEFAQVYLDRGILYWREMDHPRRAIIDLTRALDMDPDLIEAYFNRGVAYQQLREYDRAITEYKTYLAIGTHPYWREYAENMVRELSEWIIPEGAH